MPTSNELLERLERAFGTGSERLVAERLIDFLATHPETSHISLQMMRQLTPGGASGRLDVAILRTLQFFAGDGISLLDTRFEIVDSEDHPHGLDREEVKDAISLRVNPLTGENDPDVAAKITMFFAPHPEAVQQLAGPRE